MYRQDRTVKIFAIAGGFSYGNLGDRAMLAEDFRRLSETEYDFVLVPPVSQDLLFRGMASMPEFRLGKALQAKFVSNRHKLPLVGYCLRVLTLLLNSLANSASTRFRGILIPKEIRYILQHLSQSDIVLVIGGGNINDIWPKTALIPIWLLLKSASIFRKPIYCFGQTIGPFNNPFYAVLASHVLRRTSIIMVRDPHDSVRWIRRIGVRGSRPKIMVTGDDAFTIASIGTATASKMLSEAGVDMGKMLVGVCIHDRFESCQRTDMDPITDLFADVCDYIVETFDAHVVFYSMRYYRKGEVSRPSSASIKDKMRNPGNTTVLLGEYSPEEVKGMTAMMHIAIGTRYHFGVFAMSSTVPAILFYPDEYYSIKNNGLMNLMHSLSVKLIGSKFPEAIFYKTSSLLELTLAFLEIYSYVQQCTISAL